MGELSEFIKSGILEMYVLGNTTAEQTAHVERMVHVHHEIRSELHKIEITLENYALSQATAVDPTVKPFLMATIDYMERIKNGEQRTFPPALHADSLITDYSQWLNRSDMSLSEPLKEIEARIIGHTDRMTTVIVWIKNGAPPEVHKKEYESFLIVEGTCNIVVDGNENHLKPGDIFTIPLYLYHYVQVTSEMPCKIILQRLVA
jgi:mannose-6-phosphate isomerase-like protein (cupin superfamily)